MASSSNNAGTNLGKLLNPLYYFGIARDKIIATLLNRYLGDFFKYINQDDFKVNSERPQTEIKAKLK